MSDEELKSIAREVAACITACPVSDAMLMRMEAMRYAKLGSESAFCRWTKKWKVTPSQGRYSRTALDLALARESGEANIPATLKAWQRKISLVSPE